jgi:hypothetical protein
MHEVHFPRHCAVLLSRIYLNTTKDCIVKAAQKSGEGNVARVTSDDLNVCLTLHLFLEGWSIA